MELDEAKQILNDNGYLLEKQVQKNIVLYHGCRNGNLKIDYNRENEIWLTPDIQMAVDYACKREINRYGDHSIVTTLNKNSKSCVYKIKLNSDVNLIDFTNEKDRKLFLAKALELREIDDMDKKDMKEHLENLKLDYLRFVKYFYGLNGLDDFRTVVKELGYDGIISNELGFYAKTSRSYGSRKFGKGVSYYIFNINAMEVLDVLTPEEIKPYLKHNEKIGSGY